MSSFQFGTTILYFLQALGWIFLIFLITPFFIYLFLLVIQNFFLYSLNTKLDELKKYFCRFIQNYFNRVKWFDVLNPFNWFNFSFVFIILFVFGGVLSSYYGLTLIMIIEIIGFVWLGLGFIVQTPINNIINSRKIAKAFETKGRYKFYLSSHSVEGDVIRYDEVWVYLKNVKYVEINDTDNIKTMNFLNLPLTVISNNLWEPIKTIQEVSPKSMLTTNDKNNVTYNEFFSDDDESVTQTSKTYI